MKIVSKLNFAHSLCSLLDTLSHTCACDCMVSVAIVVARSAANCEAAASNCCEEASELRAVASSAVQFSSAARRVDSI